MKFAQPLGYLAHGPATYRDDRAWPRLDDPPVSDAELEAFLARRPDVTTPSLKIRRALAYIDRFRPKGPHHAANLPH